MNILLLGATGATGQQILNQALRAGDTVTVLVRHTGKLTITHPHLRIIVGDATSKAALASAMHTNEVLISTLGAMNTPVITQSTTAILAAAKNTSLKRIIMLSSFAVKRNQLTPSAKFLTGLAMKKIIADKIAGETLLRAGNLQWTIVYATALTNQPKNGHVRVMAPGEKIGLKNRISRANVASWILAEIRNESFVDQEVVISAA